VTIQVATADRLLRRARSGAGEQYLAAEGRCAQGRDHYARDDRRALPAKAGQRRSALEELRHSRHTIVVYEAPHRIREALEDIAATLGSTRPLVISRELTKIHEEFIRGTVAEVVDMLKERELKGEITLLIGPGQGQGVPEPGEGKTLAARLAEIIAEQKLDEKSALKVLAKERGLSKSEVYRELQRTKTRK